MDVKTAHRRMNELGHFKGTPHKRWEASKKFAIECGIDTKQFNKGLGPAWESVAKLLKGAADTAEYVPLDERSFVQLRKELARLGKIVDGYMTIAKANTQKKNFNDVNYYGWAALESGLRNFQRRSEDIVKAADKAVGKTRSSVTERTDNPQRSTPSAPRWRQGSPR